MSTQEKQTEPDIKWKSAKLSAYLICQGDRDLTDTELDQHWRKCKKCKSDIARNVEAKVFKIYINGLVDPQEIYNDYKKAKRDGVL